MLNFYLSLIKSENRSMMSLKYYFSYKSFLRKNIVEIVFNNYDVSNVFVNDMSALKSRIDYVERNEHRRSFVNIFQKIDCV